MARCTPITRLMTWMRASLVSHRSLQVCVRSGADREVQGQWEFSKGI